MITESQLKKVLKEVYDFKNINAYSFQELQNIYNNSSDFKKRIMAVYINKLISK